MFKKIRAKKSLGQNFLMNKSKLRKIVDALEFKKGDTIIEIGPGHGELTDEIIARLQNCKIKKIILVEKDEKLVEILKNLRETKWKQNKDTIKIIAGDIFKILPKIISDQQFAISNYKIAGNIPYYITGYLLRVISELKFKPETVVFTIQKEVAQRICAQPPRMNLLAASVQFWAEPKIIGYISKKDFRPAPKVDSAIIRLKVTSDKRQVKSEKYYKFIKILFKQPRKTIFNNFCGARKENIDECRNRLLKTGIDPSGRPQNLTIRQLKEMSKYEII